MGNPIPIQERSVDPYSSYDSNVVNKLTRIISDGNNILLSPSPMYCEFLSQHTVKVKAGKAIMDDVLIEIQDIDIDFNDSDYFVNDLDTTMTEGYHLIVLCYQYIKTSPAPTASVKIIKAHQKNDPAIFNRQTMMFINAIHITLLGGLTITEILGFDPDDPTLKRNYAGGSSSSSGVVAEFKEFSISGDITPDDNNIIAITTNGNIVLDLPLISTTTKIVRFIKITPDVNVLTVQRSGADTIEGDINIVLNQQYEAVTLMPYKPTNVWIRI